MHAIFPSFPKFPSAAAAGRRLAPRSAFAAAALLMLLTVSAGTTSAWAQQPLPAPETEAGSATSAGERAPAIAAASPTAGLSRAQVIAELECARASGELDAAMLNSYGLPPRVAASQRPASAAGCGQRGIDR